MTVAERNIIDELPPEQRDSLREHEGEWVALSVDPVEILAFAKTPSAAYEAARKAGVVVPYLYQVPDPRSGAYYY